MFVGEIRLFPYTRIDQDWLACNGQLVSTTTYAALFNLIKTTYGGNGTSNFALPNLNGRAAVGTNGKNLPGAIGTTGGSESVVLNIAQIPAHSHQLVGASTLGTAPSPRAAVPAAASKPASSVATPPNLFSTSSSTLVQLNPIAIGSDGGGSGHENRQPFIALCYCIAPYGDYPSPGESEAP